MAGARATRKRPATWRAEIVTRFLELRPTVMAKMQASIPAELHAELESVTARQLYVLTQLPPEGLAMRQFAVSLGITAAAASVLADRLTAQGLAERRTDPGDRRLVRLAPSPQGRAAAERYLEAQRRALSDLLARLSDEQAEAWLDIMETLAAGDPPGGPPPHARQAGHARTAQAEMVGATR
jgi:DNA-binding MarR family transcriptional regulator